MSLCKKRERKNRKKKQSDLFDKNKLKKKKESHRWQKTKKYTNNKIKIKN